ncbi:MAG TPA: endonuclease/exonuclease/phosphatase family protein [Burkholderiaceae bacterium]
MKIRVATYNIHKGVSSLGSRPRVHALKQAISAFDAQMIFLQEVQGRHDKHTATYGAHRSGAGKHWPAEAQHEFLAGDSHHSAYGLNAAYDHGHHGNALLSSFPIDHHSNRDVSDHAYEKRGILHCVVKADDDTDIHCYVVHLGLFSSSRGRQTEALIRAVTETAPPDAPVIIAGDFNDWRNELSDTLRQALGVIEVFDERRAPTGRLGQMWRRVGGGQGEPRLKPARTFPAALPCLPLDRIYVRGFTVEHAQVMHGPRWAKLSDHAPVVASLIR